MKRGAQEEVRLSSAAHSPSSARPGATHRHGAARPGVMWKERGASRVATRRENGTVSTTPRQCGPREKVCLLDELMIGVPVNVGVIIKNVLRRSRVNEGQSFGFGGLLTRLCMDIN
ncbi:hypothetical protein HAX54_050401 [Datura stramonium]|uniref:Uncharacterized protein n=1 Tax=Datura stramonium TaxID=4076 RepID=A0ABS8WQ71_DATST|nr:hypothetical protein [Datura stramonium]